MVWKAVAGWGAALLLLPAVATGQTAVDAQRAETYEAVTAGVDGSPVITTSDRRTIVLQREGEQTAFANPIISAGRAAVGAQAEFARCIDSVAMDSRSSDGISSMAACG